MARRKAVTGGRKPRSGTIWECQPLDRRWLSAPPKKTPRKAASRGKWSEEELLTNDKSALVNADLVKLLASSAAWNCLEEDEKRQVLNLLPADTHPNPDPPTDDPNAKIPPLPDSFVRYSNNWRDGIRQFQLDLENGRYDPQWLRQADEARKQREDGAFDSFKEREYEQFWGQKQKSTNITTATGEAGKIKLATLIDAGVFHIGDIWRFTYVYGRGADRIYIDKEARIQEIHGPKLTFVMPAGERSFLRSSRTHSPKLKLEDQESQPVKPEENTSTDVKEMATDASANSFHQQQEILDLADVGKEEPDGDTSISIDLLVDVAEEPSVDFDKVPADESSPSRSFQDESMLAMITSSPLSSPLSSPPPSSPLDWSPEAEMIDEEMISSVRVVIRSPEKLPSPGIKRPIPQPAEESQPKRKRGRPRKIQDDPSPETNAIEEQQLNIEPEAEVFPVSSSNVQVVLQSMSGLEPKSEQPALNEPVDPVQATTSSNATEDALQSIKSSPIAEIPSPTSMPTDVDIDTAPATQPDEVHTSNNLQHDSHPEPEITGSPTPSDPAAETSNDGYEEVIIHDIVTPRMLVHSMLGVDGRRKDGRTSNAWKEVRCYRNNQDMGSLWDVRQAWFFKQT
ncbi:uncharacterized protein N7483_012005 [Penicillium malachiteum]|uniref:uncharacterized protein n=1 Tax=Penicillium malachiteum TaxID=1324776 RepID=UPI002547D4CD|nr:uncharacterized protein N7483_012005 [Penicillium malachiteum]KAJ5714824.1 hypothetical protein N7483_012005 [Penicillium malachiteum]